MEIGHARTNPIRYIDTYNLKRKFLIRLYLKNRLLSLFIAIYVIFIIRLVHLLWKTIIIKY